MPDRPIPQPGILDIAPYKAGEGHADGANAVTKLSSNENPLGPSPKAVEAAQRAAEAMEIYPSSDHADLRAALAHAHGLNADKIVCGAGSDEVISLLCQGYCGPGDQVIHTEHGFAMYPISARAAGATPEAVPEQDRVADVDAILAAVTEATRIVFLANPNNPTGTFLADTQIRRLAEGLPANVLLVLDGAYAEYVEGFDGGAALVEAHENVVMTRTFSKIYGMGGMRVGWAYAPDHVVDVLNRIRGPFNVSATGLAAAEAAVRDAAYVARCRAANADQRDRLTSGLRALGLPTDDSFANFVLPRFANAAQAASCDAALRAQGIIVRNVAGYGLPEFLRITVGDELACQRVLTIIGDHLNTDAA